MKSSITMSARSSLSYTLEFSRKPSTISLYALDKNSRPLDNAGHGVIENVSAVLDEHLSAGNGGDCPARMERIP